MAEQSDVIAIELQDETDVAIESMEEKWKREIREMEADDQQEDVVTSLDYAEVRFTRIASLSCL
jgi:hypothetical protein